MTRSLVGRTPNFFQRIKENPCVQGGIVCRAGRAFVQVAWCNRGSAALWLLGSRRKPHFLLMYRTVEVVLPNVRAKRATTAGRQARAGENVPRTARPGLVACRWRSA